jgi:hypothetical protein
VFQQRTSPVATRGEIQFDFRLSSEHDIRLCSSGDGTRTLEFVGVSLKIRPVHRFRITPGKQNVFANRQAAT